jgi:hypothetical protein
MYEWDVTYLLVFAGIGPVVNLSLSLARQIHCYLVESQLLVQEQQHKQMEQMLQEGVYSGWYDHELWLCDAVNFYVCLDSLTLHFHGPLEIQVL